MRPNLGSPQPVIIKLITNSDSPRERMVLWCMHSKVLGRARSCRDWSHAPAAHESKTCNQGEHWHGIFCTKDYVCAVCMCAQATFLRPASIFNIAFFSMPCVDAERFLRHRHKTNIVVYMFAQRCALSRCFMFQCVYKTTTFICSCVLCFGSCQKGIMLMGNRDVK